MAERTDNLRKAQLVLAFTYSQAPLLLLCVCPLDCAFREGDPEKDGVERMRKKGWSKENLRWLVSDSWKLWSLTRAVMDSSTVGNCTKAIFRSLGKNLNAWKKEESDPARWLNFAYSNLDGQVDGIESLLQVVFLNRGGDVWKVEGGWWGVDVLVVFAARLLEPVETFDQREDKIKYRRHFSERWPTKILKICLIVLYLCRPLLP